jgi:hypothetical protein
VLLIALGVLAVAGPLGFNPTDDAFLLGAAQRVLDGQIPHAQFISPRPLGSAVLHLPDLLVPGPTLMVSRGIAALELTLATVVLASLSRRTPPWRWGTGWVMAVAAATMVNLHLFPLTVWHTIDGVLLVACSWAALRRGLAAPAPSAGAGADPRGWRVVGLLLAGAAITVKQSFAPALVVAGIWTLWAAWRDGRLTWRRVVGDGLLVGLAGLAYALVLVRGGALEVALGQLLSAESVWGNDLFVGVWSIDGAAQFLTLGGLSAAALAALLRLGSERQGPPGAPACWQFVAAAVAGLLTALVVWVPIGWGELALDGAWSRVLWWIGAAVALAAVVAGRRPWALGAALLLGWMVSLSWGYAWPSFVAGSIGIATAAEAWRGVPSDALRSLVPDARHALAGATAGVVVLAVVGGAWVTQRRAVVYRDQSADQLTADLGEIDPDLWGIRSNPAVADHLRSIKDCVADYPASRVAVIPDDAAIGALLELDDPLISDWLFPVEMGGQEDRLLAAAEELDGDVLVLATVEPVHTLWAADIPSRATVDDVPFSYVDDLSAKVLDAVDGERIACGPFVGVWSPAQPTP